jgi:hypothetical protein
MFFVVRKIVQVELVRSEDKDAVVMPVVVRLGFNFVAIAVLVASLHGNVNSSFAADSKNVKVAKIVDSVRSWIRHE